MKVKSESEVAQSCQTLSDPMDCSQPGSSVHGIFQARVLEWVPLHWKPKNILLEHWVAETERKWKRHAVIESNMKGLGNYVKALELSEEQEEAMISFVF